MPSSSVAGADHDMSRYRSFAGVVDDSPPTDARLRVHAAPSYSRQSPPLSSVAAADHHMSRRRSFAEGVDDAAPTDTRWRGHAAPAYSRPSPPLSSIRHGGLPSSSGVGADRHMSYLQHAYYVASGGQEDDRAYNFHLNAVIVTNFGILRLSILLKHVKLVSSSILIACIFCRQSFIHFACANSIGPEDANRRTIFGAAVFLHRLRPKRRCTR